MADDGGVSDEPDPRIAELNAWQQDDPDIRIMCSSVFAAWGARSAQHLASEIPDVFDELYESAQDLLEQSPTPKGPEWLV